ncbi:MAG: nickel-dependent lactate racemase [Deltaproteobacteria bacterium]|nr:nickel-dependent lactate racemase [Deltaproteobacteria bacterium]
MEISLKYGQTALDFRLPDEVFGGFILPARTEQAVDGERLISSALENPVGSPKLRDLVKPGETVAVVASDVTRPCPTAIMLPPILKELAAGGVAAKDVVIVLALGIHRNHTVEEKIRLVGQSVFDAYQVVDHDPNRCRRLGETSRGTPADIFEKAADADRRVALGNVEYHYFAGYSGGAKALLPGVSSHAAIKNNHAMMVHELAKAGILEGNPVREDIDELPKHLSVDFILNVVLGEDKKIKGAFGGHCLAAHRAACKMLDGLFQATVPAPGADVVVVSAGGFPKDINIYQAQKALDNAAKAVRPGGSIVWVGACDEGFGEAVFEKWLNEAKSSADLIERVKTKFELGGHKAAAIALVLERCRVFMVSNLPEETAKKLFVTPAKGLEEAVKAALEQAGKGSKVWVMPHGGSTLPKIVS